MSRIDGVSKGGSLIARIVFFFSKRKVGKVMIDRDHDSIDYLKLDDYDICFFFFVGSAINRIFNFYFLGFWYSSHSF